MPLGLRSHSLSQNPQTDHLSSPAVCPVPENNNRNTLRKELKPAHDSSTVLREGHAARLSCLIQVICRESGTRDVHNESQEKRRDMEDTWTHWQSLSHTDGTN